MVNIPQQMPYTCYTIIKALRHTWLIWLVLIRVSDHRKCRCLMSPWWSFLALLSWYPIFKSKSLQLICRIWHSLISFMVLELQMIWSHRELTIWGDTRLVTPVVASRWHAPSVPEHLQLWHWLRLKPKFVFHLSFRKVLVNGRNVTYVTSSATGWNLGYLRSLPTRLFVQQHVKVNIKENTTVLSYCPTCGRFPSSPMDSQTKWFFVWEPMRQWIPPTKGQ